MENLGRSPKPGINTHMGNCCSDEEKLSIYKSSLLSHGLSHKILFIIAAPPPTGFQNCRNLSYKPWRQQFEPPTTPLINHSPVPQSPTAEMKPTLTFQALAALPLFVPTTWAAFVQSWSAGTFQLTAPGPFCFLDGGVNMHVNSDGNIVIFESSRLDSLLWSSGKTTPNCNGACQMVFQSDGNLVTYNGNQVLFQSGTAKRGSKMVCYDQYPYLEIFDADGNILWHAASQRPLFQFPNCLYKKTEPWRCYQG